MFQEERKKKFWLCKQLLVSKRMMQGLKETQPDTFVQGWPSRVAHRHPHTHTHIRTPLPTNLDPVSVEHLKMCGPGLEIYMSGRADVQVSHYESYSRRPVTRLSGREKSPLPLSFLSHLHDNILYYRKGSGVLTRIKGKG